MVLVKHLECLGRIYLSCCFETICLVKIRPCNQKGRSEDVTIVTLPLSLPSRSLQSHREEFKYSLFVEMDLF